MALIEAIKKLFARKQCDHRFTAEEVHDFNVEPRCTRCNHYFSAIVAKKGKLKFELLKDGDYTVKRLK